MAGKLVNNKPVKKAGAYWATLGPGLTTGAADDDPSGIATYSQTGAQYSFNLLWMAAFSFPLMAIVQEMCARIGLVTGRGLAGNIRRHYPAWVLYVCTALLFIANTFNIGADLGAMAKATQLLLPQTGFYALVIFFTVLSLVLQIFTSYAQYAKYLKWLALVLLAYILSAFFLDLNGKSLVFHTFIPHINFNRDEIFLICGILGTTISPYLFFWQTSQEVEEQIMEGKTSIKLRQSETTDEEISKMRIDVWSGMFFSNLTMFFIIVTCATALYQHGITDIKTAADAAAALKPIAGPFASLLFTLGIVGVGLLAVPVLAGSTAYAMSEAMGWKQGLYRKLKQAYPFYGVIIISMLLGMLMNFLGLDPIKGLIYAAVLNGLVAPVILVLIVQLSSNKKVMNHRVNSRTASTLGWIITGLMIIVGVATIAILISPI
ncbi:MAG: divalent metal cation transporter [Candidatus Doudnabacteria bacterium]|nr:divalent metal cation transporter [Candidatus Doudnabacteria bacterium]